MITKIDQDRSPVGIIGTGSYLPQNVFRNSQFQWMTPKTEEWIHKKIGVRERRLASPEETTSDLALKASREALQAADLSPQAIGLIILSTNTPDVRGPSTACILQTKLGAGKAAAYSITAACAGFNCLIAMGAKYVADGIFRNVLVVCAETIGSKFTDWSDRMNSLYFGDGAGAAVISRVKTGTGILCSYLKTDGKDSGAIIGPATGSRCPTSEETIRRRMHFVEVDGKKIQEFAVFAFPDAVKTVLDVAGLLPSDINLILAHQANITILREGMKSLGLPIERTYTNIEKYGNAGGASLPIVLDEAVRLKKVKRGDYIVLVGFGAGLSWGANVVRW